MPEGRVVISGINPASLWGLRQWRAHIYRCMGFGAPFLPTAGAFISYWRLRDWLRLLNFEVEAGSFGCYRPAVRSERWLGRFGWMDRAGDRWWPIFGAVYFLVAVKRVHGMRLLSPAWKPSRSAASAPVSIAHRAGEAAYALYSLIPAAIVSLSVALLPAFSAIKDFGWFIGAPLAGIIYYFVANNRVIVLPRDRKST